MTRRTSALVLAALTARAQDIGAAKPAAARKRLVPTAHPDAQWFPEAGLGLFLHWGISSVHGGIDLSWGMMHGMGSGPKITPEEYFRLAERFRPDHWDPDSILAAAKRAGFRYAVLTAKHHDGFALWPSDHGEFNTRKHAGGRDLIRPFIEACRKNGLKAGLYYSPGDWYYSREVMSFNYRSANCWQNSALPCRPEVPDFNTRFEPVTLPKRTPEWEAKYRAYQRGQITELLTRYGKIDLLWFDMATVVMAPSEIRALQPGIVINDRMGNGTGDFLTVEGAFPKARPEGWWELCTIWNSPYWGYVASNEERYRPLAWVLETLAKTRAWGGNLLLNAGPRPDGGMPRPYWEGAAQLAAWMRHSGESLFGTKPGGWPDTANVPVTTKGRTWFLHVPPAIRSIRVSALPSAPSRVTMLNGGRALPFEFRDGSLSLAIPEDQRTDLLDVVSVRFGEDQAPDRIH